MRHTALLRTLTLITCALCLVVVVLGAYVRLSAAGLGCPDWPGCYGHLTPSLASVSAPGFEFGKAWREMLHRYAAGTLGLLIACVAALSWLWRRERIAPPGLALTVLGVVLLQGIFGMLTVTWRLNALIVTLHLLFGLTTLSLLWWLLLRLVRPHAAAIPRASALARALAAVALAMLILQIALGGWTSSNYAAIACPDLPTCQGSWWPPAHFRAAYALHHSLDTAALVAIHLTHRIGAMLAGIALLLAALVAWRQPQRPVRRAALAVLAMLGLQLTLGVCMVLNGFPLWLATAHNAGAALLLLATLWLNYSLQPGRARAVSSVCT